jgi:hypothetical protein
VKNTSFFNYNPELKNFLDGYLENKPNLEIVRITNPESIGGIEKALKQSQNSHGPSEPKRTRIDKPPVTIGQSVPRATFMQPGSSKLLNALAGRYSNNRR